MNGITCCGQAMAVENTYSKHFPDRIERRRLCKQCKRRVRTREVAVDYSTSNCGSVSGNELLQKLYALDPRGLRSLGDVVKMLVGDDHATDRNPQ